MEDIDYKKLYEEQAAQNDILISKNRRLNSLVTAYRTHLAVLEKEMAFIKRNVKSTYSVQKDDKLDAYAPKSFVSLGTAKIRNNPAFNYVFVIFDIDDFKGINDTYGHYIGDIALKSFVNLLNSSTRQEIDLVGRFGGDEFVLLLEDISLDDAEKKINDILLRVMETPITVTLDGGDTTFYIHASAGITEFDRNIDYSDIVLVDTAGLSEEEMIERRIYRANFIEADTALYQAKITGKNRVGIAGQSETIKRELNL